MRVRTKHAGKTCVGLWSQSVILKTVYGVTDLYPPTSMNVTPIIR